MIKSIHSGVVVIVNNVTITKDLIFGWCVLSDQSWIVLTDLDIETLQWISKQVSGQPLCPTDFADAVSAEIAVLKSKTKPLFTEIRPLSQQGLKFYKTQQSKEDLTKPFSQPSSEMRQKDSLELYKLMFKNITPLTDGGMMVNLGYCMLEIFKNGTVLLKKTHRVFKSGEGQHVFENVDNAADFILKTYW